MPRITFPSCGGARGGFLRTGEAFPVSVPGSRLPSPDKGKAKNISSHAGIFQGRTGNPRNSFGLLIATDLDEQDRTWQETGTASPIWVMKIRSAGAPSLSFVFRDVYLPKKAEMYLFAPTGFMVMGPIRAEHIHGGVYASDLIYGEEVVLAVRMQSNESATFRLRMDKVIHGYAGRGSRDYGDAAACNIDVNCAPFGNGWELERDAVGLIIYGGNELCSGSLINNACESLVPLFLTALHCIDGIDGTNKDQEISQAEQNELSNWTFRFNYDSPDPLAGLPPGGNNCRGLEPTSWLTYSGAQYRAGWSNMDFALIELNGSLLGQSSLALAGWDRRNIFPESSTSIHHPRGDVKKISHDDDPAISWSQTNPALPDYYEVIFDAGIAESGSSGSPFFNPEHLIIGQQLSVDPFLNCSSTFNTVYFPRLFHSWTGGGTSDSRLSDWLDPNGTGVEQVPGVRVPSITTAGGSGFNLLCEDDELLVTLNAAFSGGAEVSWEASPSDFFRTSAGQGSSATLSPNQGVSGPVSIAFLIVLGNGCGSLTLSQNFFVGPPLEPEFITAPDPIPPSTVVQLAAGEKIQVFLTATPGATPSSAQWWKSGSLVVQDATSGIKSTFTASVSPLVGNTGHFYVQTSNTCGLSPVAEGEVWVNYPEQITAQEATSSPGHNLTITIPAIFLDGPGTWQLLHLQGQVLQEGPISGAELKLSLSHLPAGLYFLRLAGPHDQSIHRIRVLGN